VNDTELRAIVRSALGEIAPEADLASLPDDAELREELELDSMDFLNLVTALHEQTGVDVPERDYPQLTSVDGCVEYLARQLGA
jgi:acyl carrier protein